MRKVTNKRLIRPYVLFQHLIKMFVKISTKGKRTDEDGRTERSFTNKKKKGRTDSPICCHPYYKA